MAQTADHVIELLVGLVCLGLAAPAWTRGGGGRIVAVVLAIAGLAAAGHAVVALVQ